MHESYKISILITMLETGHLSRILFWISYRREEKRFLYGIPTGTQVMGRLVMTTMPPAPVTTPEAGTQTVGSFRDSRSCSSTCQPVAYIISLYQLNTYHFLSFLGFRNKGVNLNLYSAALYVCLLQKLIWATAYWYL